MANDYVREQDFQQSSISSNRVVAFFDDKDDAYSAVRELKDKGFTSDQIGLAFQDEDSDRIASSSSTGVASGDRDRSVTGIQDQSDSKSMWQEIKDFFTGSDHDVSEDEYTRTDFRDSTSGLNWNDERSSYYQSGIERGGAIVTVTGSRVDEARSILEQHEGDLRETGFDSSRFTSTGNYADNDISGVQDNVADRSLADTTANADRSSYARENSADVDRERRIQLRGELLRTHKERVQRGEVRLRKEVVSENQTVNVPVTREELVIERVSGSGAPVSGDLGEDQEVRVPLTEERVHVEKQPVVNEEVRVGKRKVQRTEQVSDNVRHEELRVDKDGDVDVDEGAVSPRRKKPAA